MAGYYKQWDIAEADSDFAVLRLIDRGMLSELHRLCKSKGDTDRLVYRSLQQLAQEVATDVRTVIQSLSRITKTDLVKMENSIKAGKSIIVITLTYYHETQQAKTISELREMIHNSKATTATTCSPYLAAHNSTEQSSTEHREKKKKPGGADPSGLEPIQAIVDKFNSICQDLPKVKQSTEPRLKRLTKLRKENPDDGFWDGLFARVHASDFLCGRVDGRSFVASFDWILKPANLTKILEGNYDNRTGKGAGIGTDKQNSRTGTTGINPRSGGITGESGKYAGLAERRAAKAEQLRQSGASSDQPAGTTESAEGKEPQ